MVHGMLSDAYGEFFIQPAHALPERRPDGSEWSPEELTYHDWHAAFGVRRTWPGRQYTTAAAVYLCVSSAAVVAVGGQTMVYST
jgi:hypothetical protein